MTDTSIAVLGTLGGSILGAIVGGCIAYWTSKKMYERQKQDEENRLKNDLISNIRILMTEPAFEEFNQALVAVDATDELIKGIKKFRRELKILLYKYHRYQENEGIFNSLLRKFNLFVYQVERHNIGYMRVRRLEGNRTIEIEEIFLDKHIFHEIFTNENDKLDVIKIFEVFITGINDLPNTLK